MHEESMTKKKEEKEATKVELKAGKVVPIKWNVSADIISRFATNILVQKLDNEFKISFFEIKPPISFSEKDQLPDNVPADCVASIIVTANRLPGFIEVLRRQMEKYGIERKDSNLN